MKKKLKIALGFLILGLTVAAFVYYIANHPQLIDTLRDTNPARLVLLLFLYLVWFGALIFILRVSIRLFDKTIPLQENVLLNAYSSLINFFGPGQSGPAFRGLYLKKRHGLRIKDYMFATLIYYGFYAVFSALFLVVGSRPWWQTIVVVGAAAGGSVLIIRRYLKRSSVTKRPGLNIKNLWLLFELTGLQMVTQFAIYYVELVSVNPGTSFSQALTYTGVANFALFVSLTPGAIGIREAFLVFSQQLHNLSNAVIVAANVIDRAIYFVFLGILFVLTLTLHAKDKLRLKQIQREA